MQTTTPTGSRTAMALTSPPPLDDGPPPDRVAEALNAELPSDVAVSSAEEAPPDLHARRSAVSRAYRYRVYRRREPSPFEERRSWWYPRPLDEDALAESADLLVGEHDFRAFTPAQTHHKVFARVVKNASWHRRGDVLELEIEADSFLRHMIRTLVGTMIEQSPAQLEQLLTGVHGRSDAGSTAPPWGLYLERVQY